MGFERRSIWTALLAVGAVTGVLAAGGGSLAWQKGDGFRVAPLRIPTSGKTGFTLLPPGVTGVNFTNTLPDERAMTNANLMNGSGVALGDYDRDGLCDIYLCNLNGRALQEPRQLEVRRRHRRSRRGLPESDFHGRGLCRHKRRRLSGSAGHLDGRAECVLLE